MLTQCFSPFSFSPFFLSLRTPFRKQIFDFLTNLTSHFPLLVLLLPLSSSSPPAGLNRRNTSSAPPRHLSPGRRSGCSA